MNNLKNIRLKKGLTQLELARRYSAVLGKDKVISTATISAFEREEANLNPLTVMALANALGVSTADITGQSYTVQFEEEPITNQTNNALILKELDALQHDLNMIKKRCDKMLAVCDSLTSQVLKHGHKD